METGEKILDGIVDVDSINAAMSAFKAVPHALTSSKELTAMWNEKVKELGLVFSKEESKYIAQFDTTALPETATEGET